jgi:hypothetical protein
MLHNFTCVVDTGNSSFASINDSDSAGIVGAVETNNAPLETLTLNPTGSDLHVSSTGSEHHLGPSGGGGGGAAGAALTREREQG